MKSRGRALPGHVAERVPGSDWLPSHVPPGFAEAVTSRELLSHQSGLSAFPGRILAPCPDMALWCPGEGHADWCASLGPHGRDVRVCSS